MTSLETPPTSLTISLDGVLPLIRRVVGARAAPGDGIDDVLAIYADRLVLLSVKKKQTLPDAAFAPDGHGALLAMKSLGPRLELGWPDIARLECSATHFYGSRLNGSREEGREMRIAAASGATTRVFLPEEDATLIRGALPILLGNCFADGASLPKKYRPAQQLPRRKEGSPFSRRSLWLLVIFLLAGLSLPLGALLDLDSEITSILGPVAGITAGVALLFLLINVGLSGTRALGYESQFKKRRKVEKMRAKRSKQDLSGRRPWRSRPLGWALKILGALVAIAGKLGAIALAVALPGEQARAADFVQLLAFLLAVTLIYVGYRLGQRPAEAALAKDTRPPILFLRPFEIDGRTDLNPPGALAQWLGLQAFGWLRILGPIGNIHPLRMIRLFFSTTADHSEEQMARFFRQHGPFVAIGRPGERFSLGGAARLYVSDQDWQSTVLGFLQNAQFIVLHPSLSEGVRWEIQQVAQYVPPDRLLLCLTWFEKSQARYDEFRLHFESDTGFRLPRPVGEGSFACFDAAGQGMLLPIRLRTPLKWPLVGCAVDFARTLQPFFARREGSAAPVAPKPGKFSWFVQGALACGLWIPLLLAPDFLLGGIMALGQKSYAETAAVQQWEADTGAREVASGADWSWRLRPAWQQNTALAPAPNVLLYMLGEMACVTNTVHQLPALQTFQEDLDTPSLLAAVLSEMEAGEGGFKETAARRAVALGGQTWLETEFDKTVEGLELHYIVRVLARPRTRFILTAWAERQNWDRARAPLIEALDGVVVR